MAILFIKSTDIQHNYNDYYSQMYIKLASIGNEQIFTK